MARQRPKFVRQDVKAATRKPESEVFQSWFAAGNGWELRLPVGDKDVEFLRGLGVPGRGKNQFFPVAREHREAVEAGAVGDSF